MSILDAETQREREWWAQGGADTCALFCEWMALYLATNQTANEPDASIDARKKHRKQLLDITSQLHPQSTERSSAEEWEELRSNIPDDARTLFDAVAETNEEEEEGSLQRNEEAEEERRGGRKRTEGAEEGRGLHADLPAVWRKLQANQMGSYTHVEHVGGGYERLWRYFTGTGWISALPSLSFPKPEAVNPHPSTPNPEPQTLNPNPVVETVTISSPFPTLRLCPPSPSTQTRTSKPEIRNTHPGPQPMLVRFN